LALLRGTLKLERFVYLIDFHESQRNRAIVFPLLFLHVGPQNLLPFSFHPKFTERGEMKRTKGRAKRKMQPSPGE
jgi:hypothetical protein